MTCGAERVLPGKAGCLAGRAVAGCLVVKVHDKIFAFLAVGAAVGAKAGSTHEETGEWLARYHRTRVVMAYIGWSGWDTLHIGGSIPDDELPEARSTHPMTRWCEIAA